ncbi:DUF2225 domain-containing protein [Clostridium paraputrificum]|uniref:DUF2225 domain-containing protein n=1 Tax=Clostridium TaxID=1485 RepID=UPI003D3532E8
MDIDINKHIFDKEIVCPICNNKFKTKVVKVNSPRITSKDSDLFIRYSVANPYLYDVWLCNNCGYAAMKADFLKTKSFHRDLILNTITKKWNPRTYPDVLTPTNAVERYKLALLSAIAMEKPNSTKGMILLKISWMYRLLEDSREQDFLNQALNTLTDAYALEDFPIYGMQRDSLSYLIGDLNRRCNNHEDALKWYSKVITTVGASQRVKELARNGKDSIKEGNYK